MGMSTRPLPNRNQPPAVGIGTHPPWSGEAHLDWNDDSSPEVDLAEYLHLVWSHRWLIAVVTLVCVAMATAWAVTRPKRYRAVAKVALEVRAPQIIKTQVNMGPSYWEMKTFVKDQVQVLRTGELARRVAERLGLADGTAGLLGRIKVEPIEDTNVIELSMTGQDPEQVAEWLNLYVDEYVSYNIEDNLLRTQQVYEVIQSKLDPLRFQLQSSEEELTRFKERQGALLFADEDKNVISEQVNTLTAEYAHAKADRIQLETKIATLERLRADELSSANLPEVRGDSTIQSLQKRRSDLDLELAEKLTVYKEEHPVIKDLRGAMAGIDEQIEARIASIVSGLQTDYELRSNREASLYRNIQQLKDASIELSKQTMEYEKLRREYEQNKSFYENMLARSKEVDISSSVAINNIRVIDPAVPPGAPFSPNVPRTMLLGLVLGLFGSVGLVFAFDYLDRTLRTPEDVERHLGLDVLAVIPEYTDGASSAAREVYHGLRTALMVAARDESAQVVVVTSTVEQEGKTTTTANLGRVLAASGQRVLVIDADLRKPTLHRSVASDNRTGLSSVVLGTHTLDAVLHSPSELTGLDVLTSGPLPPNPPEMFEKSSFHALIAQARDRYDWILLDCPPLVPVVDPVVTARHADMVLLLVRFGGVRRQMVTGAIRQLQRAGVRIAGAVLNRVDLEQDRYAYYYASYGASYGSYGEAERGAAQQPNPSAS